MNNIDKAIIKILDARDEWATLISRRDELAKMVADHGISAVSLASGLKETTITQYLRERVPRISLMAIEQARYVFAHNDYISAKNYY